jgi:hypothetical protein
MASNSSDRKQQPEATGSILYRIGKIATGTQENSTRKQIQ